MLLPPVKSINAEYYIFYVDSPMFAKINKCPTHNAICFQVNLRIDGYGYMFLRLDHSRRITLSCSEKTIDQDTDKRIILTVKKRMSFSVVNR